MSSSSQEKGDWGRETIRTPTSIEEFMADVGDTTEPDIDLTEFETALVAGQADVDPAKIEITYQGKKRTVTGVVKLMRLSGNEEGADLLEDLIEVGKEAQKLVQAVHRKATGQHQRPMLKPGMV